MKTRLMFLFVSLFMTSVQAQDLKFEVRGNYSRAVTKSTLEKALRIRDMIPGYASGWINDYRSVRISTLQGGKQTDAMGKNESLTTEQRKLVRSVELSSVVDVVVAYRSVNSVTGRTENREMHVSLTVIPETEAEFAGGSDRLRSYLKEKVMDRIQERGAEYMQEGMITFTVAEDGSIANTRVTHSTGDPGTDALLETVISQMPAWNPAKNAKGIRVRQEFVLSVGNKGC